MLTFCRRCQRCFRGQPPSPGLPHLLPVPMLLLLLGMPSLQPRAHCANCAGLIDAQAMCGHRRLLVNVLLVNVMVAGHGAILLELYLLLLLFLLAALMPVAAQESAHWHTLLGRRGGRSGGGRAILLLGFEKLVD
jgi:hypothetical protein